MSAADPAYLRIAADLRDRIASGELGPGARLPSESRLMADHGVSRTVAKWAISVLKGEGLVEGRRGSGVYVRAEQQLVRQLPAAEPGAERWEHDSAHAAADERIAARLALEPGAEVMRTAYRLLVGGAPVQLVTSWEPLRLTGGTAAEWPAGPGAGAGLVDRMRAIGVRVDALVERVTARSARAGERAALRLPARGGHLFAIERTHLADGVPVETADLVLPADRYELLYRVPVG